MLREREEIVNKRCGNSPGRSDLHNCSDFRLETLAFHHGFTGEAIVWSSLSRTTAFHSGTHSGGPLDR
jgi:hypothetical protein